MSKKYNIFNKLNSLVVAEDSGRYGTSKLTASYYNSEKKIKLFNNDSLLFLKKIPDNCIDMIFADPPYFGNQSGLTIYRTDGQKKVPFS